MKITTILLAELTKRLGSCDVTTPLLPNRYDDNLISQIPLPRNIFPNLEVINHYSHKKILKEKPHKMYNPGICCKNSQNQCILSVLSITISWNSRS